MLAVTLIQQERLLVEFYSSELYHPLKLSVAQNVKSNYPSHMPIQRNPQCSIIHVLLHFRIMSGREVEEEQWGMKKRVVKMWSKCASKVAQVVGDFPRMHNKWCIMLWNLSRNREILVCDKMQYLRRRRKCRANMSRRDHTDNLLVMSRRGGRLDLLATLAIFFSTVPLLVKSGKPLTQWLDRMSGEKLSSTQAEPHQAIESAIV